MRKYIAALGLAGLVGTWYWMSRRSTVENYPQAQAAESARISNKVLTHYTLKAAYEPPATLPLYSNEDDRYRNYVNSLSLTPWWLFREPEMLEVPNCDEQKIQQRHEETLRWIPHADTECILEGNVNVLVRLDKQLAYCKYQNDSKRFEELMLEAAEHLEGIEHNSVAGLIYLFFGEREKAIELFLSGGGTSVDYLLKIIPPEELSLLVDYYLQRERPFSAGKVEWFQRNEELGRALIEQSEPYRRKMEEVKEHLSHKSYQWAAQSLAELELPFHQELAQELCQGNEDCLWEFEKYRPFE